MRWTIIAALVSAAACTQDVEPPARLLYETFDEPCDGLPCGYSQTMGPPGAALYGPGFHPGDGALTLRGNSTAVTGPGGESLQSGIDGLSLGTLEARVFGRCDSGDSIRLSAVIRHTSTSGVETEDIFDGRAILASDWTTDEPIPISASSVLDPMSPFSQFSIDPLQVDRVLLEKTGSGECSISTLIIGRRDQTLTR
ncbi:MAG: hypothetical protein AAGF12_25720 [Myxococcota bacterium]